MVWRRPDSGRIEIEFSPSLQAIYIFSWYAEENSVKVGFSMAKTYVLDTNVLIQAPYAMQCFEDNHVVIPLVVVEELDGLKKVDDERQPFMIPADHDGR